MRTANGMCTRANETITHRTENGLPDEGTMTPLF